MRTLIQGESVFKDKGQLSFFMEKEFIGPYHHPEEETGGSETKVEDHYQATDQIVEVVFLSGSPKVKGSHG